MYITFGYFFLILRPFIRRRNGSAIEPVNKCVTTSKKLSSNPCTEPVMLEAVSFYSKTVSC